jgi:hypothetical protein
VPEEDGDHGGRLVVGHGVIRERMHGENDLVLAGTRPTAERSVLKGGDCKFFGRLLLLE